MSTSELLRALDRLPRVHVLVLGDLMLDRYTWGTANRLSQEAPVVVLQADKCEDRLGGAANTANMAAGLEAKVSCVGIVGHDTAGREVVHLLGEAGIECGGVIVDPTRPTTVKERFIGRAGNRHPSQILRVDREVCTPITAELEAQLIAQIASRLSQYDVLLIPDYGKGVCTPSLLRQVIELAHLAQVPVLIDPARGVDFGRYRGASLLKPNRVETEIATGLKITNRQDALLAAAKLCQDFDVSQAVVTLDSDGMALVGPNGQARAFACQARSVYDITGAGDIVMAMLGVCLAAGTPAEEAVQLSNIAGGLEVERTGVAIITRDDIRRELHRLHPVPTEKILHLSEAVELVRQRRAEGSKIVFTNGCFDLLHVGHATYLSQAAAKGDLLIVGLNSDASVRRLKGEQRPVIDQQDRATMLAALGCVDGVVTFEADTPLALIEALRPDVLVKGGDYQAQEIVGRELVESYGGQVVVTGTVAGVSTSEIIQSLTTPAAPRLRVAG